MANTDARRILLDRWREIREADGLGTLLPRCTNRSWGAEADGVGFVTVDYRTYRDVFLSDEAGEPADLVELYWSVRTKGGVQDPQWAASVNAHVILVTEGAVGVTDLELVYRQVVTLRRALQLGGIGALTAAGMPVALHARGLLLGSELSTPVAIVDALANHADIPLTVGRYDGNADLGFRFSGSGTPSRFYQEAEKPDELRALGERFLRHDRLLETQGVWSPALREPLLPPAEDEDG